METIQPMNLLKDLRSHFSLKSLFSIIKKAIVPAMVFYVISLAVLYSSGFIVMEIIRDTAQITEKSSFLGFLSNIGIWLWVCSVAICFFVLISKKDLLNNDHKQLLLFSGILSLVLAVDDFFMIHDRYVNQNICYFVYGVLALILLLKYYKIILKIEPVAFILMGFFLMASIGTDIIQEHIPLKYSLTQIFEEGFKFTGAATWLYFNFRVGAHQPEEKS